MAEQPFYARCALRPAQDTDLSFLQKLFSPSNQELDMPVKEEDLRRLLKLQELFLLTLDEVPAGAITLEHTQAADIRDVSYRILPTLRNWGLGTIAVFLAVQYAREQENARWIYAYAAQENIPSCRILEKLGFSLRKTEACFLPGTDGGFTPAHVGTYSLGPQDILQFP